MTGKITRVLAGVVFTCGLAAAQGVPELLDVYVVRIKPEKRMEFEAVCKKIVEANRKNNGDYWVAYSTEYGSQGMYYFASSRANLGAVEEASNTFMKAMVTAFGKAGTEKIFADMNAASIMSRPEIRRRRPDLSVNPPKDQEELNKMIGESRWLRTVRTELKLGKMADYTALWMPLRTELQSTANGRPISVSQTITGPAVVYSSMFAKSLAEFDAMDAGRGQLMETEGYRSFTKGLADVATSSVWEYHKLMPELSHVPEGIAQVDPEFWHPKPALPAKGKQAARGD